MKIKLCPRDGTSFSEASSLSGNEGVDPPDLLAVSLIVCVEWEELSYAMENIIFLYENVCCSHAQKIEYIVVHRIIIEQSILSLH